MISDTLREFPRCIIEVCYPGHMDQKDCVWIWASRSKIYKVDAILNLEAKISNYVSEL